MSIKPILSRQPARRGKKKRFARVVNPSIASSVGLAIGTPAVARTFNGTSDKIQTSTSSAALNPATFTMAAWIYLSQATQADQTFNTIMGNFGGTNPTNNAFYVRYDATRGYRLDAFMGGGEVIDSGGFSAQTWVHVAATLDSSGTTATLYINGVQDQQTTITAYTPAAIPFFIGYDNDSDFFQGYIADAAVWSVALSSTEIASLAAGTRANAVGENANLVGYWPITGASPEPDYSSSTGATNPGVLTGTGLIAGPPLLETFILAPAIGTAADAGVGTATGTGTAPGISLASSVASGTGAALGIGESTWAEVGTCTGVTTAPAVGQETTASVGTCTGVTTAPAIGISTVAGVGTCTGVTTAPAIGQETTAGVGTATGVTTAPAVGQSTVAGVGTANGIGAAPGVGAIPGAGTGEADGIGAALAIGQSTVAAVGEADGIGTALGIGASTGGAKQVVGWFQQWDKKRLTVAQLREILEAQGSPWAAELTEVYQRADELKPKSRKHAAALSEIKEEVSGRIADTIDWGPVIISLRASFAATRTTLAIKHAEAVLATLRQEEDEEEALMLLAA